MELKRAEERENSASSSIAGSTRSRSQRSQIWTASFLERKVKMATKLARLTTELHLADKERRQRAALNKTKEDLKKFELEKGYEIARAEMNALLDIGGLVFADLPSENCSQERLEEYLEGQANSVTHSPADENNSPPTHSNPFANYYSTPITVQDRKHQLLIDSPIESAFQMPPPLLPSTNTSNFNKSRMIRIPRI